VSEFLEHISGKSTRTLDWRHHRKYPHCFDWQLKGGGSWIEIGKPHRKALNTVYM